MNQLEIWKDIDDYVGYYQVSNIGNVRSLTRVIDNGQGHLITRIGKVLKLTATGERRNYPSIQLQALGQKKNYKVHRLVATAFIENIDNKPEVNHKDGNTFNNSVENLEWCTSTENVRHAFSTGLLVRGKGLDCCNTKRKVKVFKGGNLVVTLVGTHAIEEFGLQNSKVLACLKGQRKTHKGFTFEEELLDGK